MSMRPEIYGVDLKPIRAIFGSGDEHIFEKINSAYQEKISELFCDEPDERAEFSQKGKEIIHRMVMEGVPFPDLECEDDVHVLVIDSSVKSDEHKLAGDTVDWHMQAFRELRHGCADKVDPDILYLLEVFEAGRPFLGKRINSSWSYYGYLDAEEVKRLFAALDELGESDYLGNSREFLFDLTDWMDGISSQNLDLYFYIS